jgi:hypothetical protein
MTSGRKQAKLLDPSEHSDDAVAVRVDSDGSASLIVAPDTLEEPIVHFHGKDDRLDKPKSKLTWVERKEWDEYVEFLTNSSKTDLPVLLEALVEHANDFDYAVELSASPKALSFLLGLLSDEEDEIRGKTALILGSAFSNNPIVQERATNTFSCFETLLERLEVEDNGLVLRRLFFAFSSLVRSNPSAIAKFHRSNGLTMLQTMFERAESNNHVLKRKILAFFTDLIDPNLVAGKVSFGSKEQMSEWCTLLQKHAVGHGSRLDESSVDVLKSITVLSKSGYCKLMREFQSWMDQTHEGSDEFTVQLDALKQ